MEMGMKRVMVAASQETGGYIQDYKIGGSCHALCGVKENRPISSGADTAQGWV